MKKLSTALILWSTLTPLWAYPHVDVYGQPEQISKKIAEHYGARVYQLEKKLQALRANGHADQGLMHALIRQKKELIQDIKHQGPFTYVQFETILYPEDKSLYTSIEIISKDQPQRLRFIDQRPSPHSKTKKKDIIDEMTQFTMLNFKLMQDPKFILDKTPCPIYHCILSYHYPELKPYLKHFNQAEQAKKAFIIHTLNHDADRNRRASAAFLMGHDPDPKTIIHTLLPHVNDPDSLVRNNVIRVLSATLFKSHLSMDPTPFIELLDSPYASDRNKSLLVLYTLADSSPANQIILTKGSERLLKMLQLQQPNNHRPAYEVLKKISQKTFGEHDIQAWRNYLESNHRG